jgi:hypothetical protein
MKRNFLKTRDIAGLLMVLFFVNTLSVNSQTIEIYQTFTSDAEIQPFTPEDTIYGISVNGSVNLESDTSLVRILLTDINGNKWMIYESYPLIANTKEFNLGDECDETCSLDETIPVSITIQIIDAELYISTFTLNTIPCENPSLLQYQAKRSKDLEKVQQMNINIQAKGWNWTADDNDIVSKYYTDKCIIFSNGRYNLQGFDYYQRGVFKYFSCHENLPDSNSLLPKSFDWRSKHDATTPGSKYDFGPDGWITPLNQVQGSCGSCWVFGSVSTVEAIINLFYNDSLNYDLSQQDVLCNAIGDCNGGSAYYALGYIASHGVIEEGCLAYHGYDSTSSKCQDSLCSEPLSNIRITSQIVLQNITTDDSLKLKLLKYGPLTIGYEPDTHLMCLIGYEVDETYLTHWIFKNSWVKNQPYDTMETSILNFNEKRGIHLPVWDDSLNLECKCLDRDKDGYYNWGIGEKPSTCPFLCSEQEDWNDNRNRIGPKDANYNGIEISPQMVVQRGLGIGTIIENGALDIIGGNSGNDIIYNYQITNSGTAQLNLDQTLLGDGIVSIEFQYPANQFQIIDLPEDSICMFSDSTSFKIKMIQGAQPGALAHVHIYLDEPDMDSIFEFTMVYNGCETSSGYDSITSEIEWGDSCRAQTRDLHIMRNGELTVKGMVRLSPEADIIVEPGGKLIVDGGCLTRSCNSELWNGIQVWGDSSLSQYPDTNQGFVSVVNGGQIEYARGGIFAGRADDGDTLFAYSGGTIYAEKAVFLNNLIDVEFLPFINRNAGNQEMENLSHFRDCIFRTHDPDGLIEKVRAHAILDGVNGVDFYTSTFSMEEIPGYPFETDDKGIGIWATDAEFNVRGMCDTNTIPCIHYDSCYFKNLRYGIKATNSGGNNYVWVTETVFDNNIAGIYLSGYHQPSVITSRFYTCTEQEPPGDLNNAFLGGLYLEGSTGYQVEENYFAGPLTEMPDSGSIATIGIYIKDSGDDENEIYNNYFTGLDAGIIAEGINRGDKTGLCLKCNDYRTCLNDMLVIEGDSNSRYLGIKESQGMDDTLSSALSGNTFTPDVQGLQAIDNGGNEKYFWSYFNDADHFNYYHHGTNQYVITYPDSANYSFDTITLVNKQKPYLKEGACPSRLIIPEYKDYEDQRLSITVADQQLQFLENKLDSLVDGGDTEGLDFEIMTSMPDEALELQQQLLSESPYLSDTVMKQAIYKENVLPNAMIRDILSVNPQSAKSDEILGALDSRFDPMPDYMMADIMQGLNQIGSLESLESKIGYWQNYRSRAINILVREFLSDSAFFNVEDSLIGLYQDENTLQSKYRLAFSYWDDENIVEAQNTLSDIPAELALSSQEQTVYQNYLDFFNILQLMSDSSFHARQLDSSAVQQLVNIMNTSLPLVSDYARALLIKGRHIEYTESVYFPMAVKKYPSYSSKKPRKAGFSEDNNLFLFPNPCGDYVIAYFNILDKGQTGGLVLYDLHGKELDRKSLNSMQDQQVITLSSYSDGIYIIRLFVEQKTLSSKILIKGRK